jgi:hypothetical protein
VSICVEEISLEEMLSGDIPCEAYVGLGAWLVGYCGKPSVARVLFTCGCGQWRGFICAECLDCYITGNYICNGCKMSHASLSGC